MIDKVLKTIHTYKMISPGDRIIAGFSGGADSTVLLHILNGLKDKMGFELFGAHINHGLRGKDGDDDASFAADICREWGISFYLKEADVLKLSAVWSMSVEEAGRHLRYLFFEELAQELKGNKIATAHHRNDQAETILHNIIRGTGIKGLGGIKPKREDLFIRPLLDISKEEIKEYVNMHHLVYREDDSNKDRVYTRNRIRHELIPSIEQHYNPAFVDTLVRMGKLLREEDEFLTEYCKEVFSRYSRVASQQISISLEFLGYHPAVRRRVIRMGIEILKMGLEGIGQKHIDDALHLAASSQVGSWITLPGNIIVGKGYEDIRIGYTYSKERISPFEIPLLVPGETVIDDLNMSIKAERTKGRGVLKTDPKCVSIDMAAIKGALRIRQRSDGDRFKPFGLKGTKKLKDFFIDKKIPKDERDRIPLVVDDENIVWVVGWQISESYKVTGDTTDILRLTMEVNNDR